MNVRLPKDIEDFVLKEFIAGEYPTKTAVVVEALREFRSKKENSPDGKGMTPENVRKLLVKAVNGPHHRMPADYFDKVRDRLCASCAK